MDFGDNPPPADDGGLDMGVDLDLEFDSPLLSGQSAATKQQQQQQQPEQWPAGGNGGGDDQEAMTMEGNDALDALGCRATPASTTSTPFDTMSMASLGSLATEANASSMAAEKRLRHLSKKNRELTASFNAEKARNTQLTKKVLQKEIGEDVPVSRILQGDSNWQGRAQQISLLKAKVHELQSQVKGSSSRSTSSLSSTRSHRSDGGVADRGRLAIQRIEEKKKADVDALTTQLTEAQDKLKQMKEKYDAGKARNRMLAREVKELKQRLDTSKQEARNASNRASELEEQVKSLEDEIQRSKLKPREKRTRHAAQADAMDTDAMFAMQELTRTCQEQAQTITSLREQLAQRIARPCSSARSSSAGRQPTMMEHVRASTASRSRSAGHASGADQGHMRALEVERDKYKELCDVLTKQLGQQRQPVNVEPLGDDVHSLSESALLQLVQDKHEEAVALQRRYDTLAQEHRQQMAVMASMVDKMKHIFSAAVKKVSSNPA
ncbi:hypothetical protein PTSG_05245 [Salpingoeca rosetta]|uniref:Coiled-coil domain-containing protein 13 n=1 Tax=Salpingoeca rosetta (strain ATCC 50818 / BSB-021) TaxID=946362 RepID=F2UAX3_SALR5|nr:uncharacterized protein PTSG_05245 [Salpingoeca rosetta]EGD73539.1 hypothetical protein PTSG_05245 [Salpingoeca rosetta]|eukprot:XP_004993821.1 hypothetical protein PTSG_05245 [Salpingoeca rosetta]